jgi:hypothetical protein
MSEQNKENNMTIEITERDFYEMRERRDAERANNLAIQARIAELTAANDRQSLIIYAKDLEVSELTRMLFDLGKQDGQTIRELKAIAANLARHLEDIQHITERDDMSDYKTHKAIRRHCEAANVMEAL